MRIQTLLLGTLAALSANAQYGTFDAKAVDAAKGTTTLVVLDGGNSPYDKALMDAVKAHWKFTGAYDFITVNDLATQPLSEGSTYVMKLRKTDPQKYEGIFLAVVAGWKQKKNEALVVEGNAVTNVPAEQELASILFAPDHLVNTNCTGFMNLYVKHLQDYLKLVSKGEIRDKTTADRTYEGRNRPLRDGLELWMAEGDLDKSLPDAAAAKAHYTHGFQVMSAQQLGNAAREGKAGVALSDVVLTGDHKNKHCFKRVFNANTGELMYQADEAALYGKKEGFLDEDLKAIERAR